jgi:hypothetical protein
MRSFSIIGAASQKKSNLDILRSKRCDELPPPQMRYTNLTIVPAANTLSVQIGRFIDEAAWPEVGEHASVGVGVAVRQNCRQRV